MHRGNPAGWKTNLTENHCQSRQIMHSISRSLYGTQRFLVDNNAGTGLSSHVEPKWLQLKNIAVGTIPLYRIGRS